MYCNFSPCRYHAYGKCTDAENRKECVAVSKAVLCIADDEEKDAPSICITNPACEQDPSKCIYALECSLIEDRAYGKRRFVCGFAECKYEKR